MKSRSKTDVSFDTVAEMFRKAGLGDAKAVEPLGAGEFNTVLAVTTEDGKRYALKVAPSDESRVLTYERGMMRAEVYWYSVMRGRTDIPVPDVLYSDFSREILPADWFVMSLIEGVHPGAEKGEDAERLADRLAVMAASKHKVRCVAF